MPLYQYRAVDGQGKTRRGQFDAANLADLELRLRKIELDLIEGAEVQPGSGWALGGKRIRRRDVVSFCFHMEQLTHAGVPLIEALLDLRDSSDHAGMRDMAADIIDNIEGGKQFSQALAEHPKVFDPVFVSMVRTGEATGRLPDVMKELAESLKWQDELSSQMTRIMIYPSIVGAAVLGVTVFLLVYLVPKLVPLLLTLQKTLPPQTQFLIDLSNFIVNRWPWLVLTPPALGFALWYWARHDPNVAMKIDDWKLRVWLIGPIIKKIIMARFANYFGMMYSSGVTVLDALAICEGLAGNLLVERALRESRTQIAEGQTIATSFANVGLFPALVLRMLRVGENTGELDKAMLNVSYFYNRDVRESIEKVQVMIEPMLTVVMGLILGWVMLAVLGPLYESLGKLKAY